jgi:NitT/TauT family transport system substrate-binding protein
LTHTPALLLKEEPFPFPVKFIPFSAGPSALQAFLAGELDLLYVGPAPIIHLATRSKKDRLRIIGGSTMGGAGFIGKGDSFPPSKVSFSGKKIAIPELGNTQDSSLRFYLLQHNLTERDVKIFPLSTAEILTTLRRGEIDGAWIVEPWLTILKKEGAGTILFREEELWEEGKYLSAILVATLPALKEKREKILFFLTKHVQIILSLSENPPLHSLQKILMKRYPKGIPEGDLKEALSHLRFFADPQEIPPLLKEHTFRSWKVGYIPSPSPPDLSFLVDSSLYEEIKKRFPSLKKLDL